MSTATDDRSLPEIMHDEYVADGERLPDVPVGALADQPVEKLVAEANMADHGQSMNGKFYGGIAMREAMIRYYDGDIDRAMVVLEECSNDALFARLYELAANAGLDSRPRPWNA